MKTNKLKGSDLRIGNLVKYCNGVYRIIEVSPIHLLVQNANDINDIQNRAIQNAEPIELTEEVLLKIGFKKGDTSPTYERYYFEVCGNGESLFLWYDFYYNGQRRLNITFRNREGVENEFKKYDIKYIHELQNAYYCLTGQELNIEL